MPRRPYDDRSKRVNESLPAGGAPIGLLAQVEALYRSGKTRELVASLKDVDVDGQGLDRESKAQFLLNFGMAQFDVGSVRQSFLTLREAEQVAAGLRPELAFAAAFSLFVRESDFQSPAVVLRGLTQLRQLAARAGDGPSLTGLYLAVARLEGHRGLCLDANRHLEIARRCATPAAPQSTICSLDLVDAGLASISGNLVRSRALASSGLEMARVCGFAKYEVGAATTLALVSLYLGYADRARELAEWAIEQSDGLTYVRLGALDTLAQVNLRREELAKSAQLFASCQYVIDNDSLPARSWYDLAHQQTRCTYHELKGDWRAVVETVDAVDAELARRQFKAVRTALLSAKARALAHLGRLDDADRVLSVAVRACPRGAFDPLIGLEAAKAVCATKRGDLSAGRTYFDRAIAAARAIGHRYHEWWIERARDAALPRSRAAVPPPHTRDVTETALLLSDVATILGAGHSIDLLVHRVRAILENTPMTERLEVQSEGGLPFEATPTASAGLGPDDTFEIRLRGSDRRFLLRISGVRSIDEISLLKSLADLVGAAVNRTTDAATDDEEQNLWPRSLIQAGQHTVFRSPRMVELLRIAGRLAETNLPVLLTGETGTGKEVLARIIHDHSKVRRGPFIAFNCSALPRDLVESQLFGHRRGAFTGAAEAFDGVVRAAEGGTLFLDEIGDLDVTIQPKLLRFLESGEFVPLGEARARHVNVRLVAATNAALDTRVSQGQFRADLLYRIDGARLALPPLRERKDEIPALASLFVTEFSRDCQRTGLRIGDDLIAALLLYDWPGNIRQLSNELRRVVAMAADGQTLTSGDLSPEVTEAWNARPTQPSRESGPTVEVRLDQPLGQAVEELERRFIEHALRLSGGRVTDAAERLGLSRKGLFLKRRRQGLTRG